MNVGLAPVVMVGYSRAWTLRKSLKNLSECYGLGDRDIYFFQDAPCRSEDIPKAEAMHQVAVEAKNTILPHLTIVRREKNLGVPGNLLSAVRETMDRYGRIIFFEDDVLVSKTFVQYMDEGLKTYERDPRIFCVNGYVNKPYRIPSWYKRDVYLNTRNSAWGWGSWKDRWDKVDFGLKNWEELKNDKAFLAKLHGAGCELYGTAEGVVSGRVKTWDVQCTVCMALNGLYAVDPRHNLTRNIGFGSEGVNCTGDIPNRTKYYNFRPRCEANLEPIPELLRQFPYSSGEDRKWMMLLNRFRHLFSRRLPSAFEEPIDL